MMSLHHMLISWLLWLLYNCGNLVTSAPCYKQNTTCVPVSLSMCLTTKVTFTHTSLIYTNSTLTQSEIQDDLEVWRQLQGVPECWSVIQPFLCSVYLPRCNDEASEVERPNRELCERVRSPCEVVKRYNGSWPWFLQCDQWFYADSCGQTVYETSNFDTVSDCSGPLIETNIESNWYDNIKGCGLQCENPLYTSSQHYIIHTIVAVLAGLSLLSTCFTLITFMLDWKVSRKYPTVILFYINGCFLIATLGWLAQFINRNDVICRKDGTIRKGEPLIGSGESASCTVVFVTIYYFMMAGIVWFVMLSYSWDIHFKALGTVRDDLSKKTAYFHIISWCLPLVLTIMCLSISVIDADSLSGICFPGFYDKWNRAGFVLAPVILALIIGAVYSIRGLLTLIKVKKDSPPFIGEKATSKIHDTIIRLGVFISSTFILVIISVSIHIYSFMEESNWNNYLMDYTYCKANVSVMEIFDHTSPSTCNMSDRPSIVAAVFHILSLFGCIILFSSWSWSKASLSVWERVFRRLCNKPSNRPQKLRKHRMVARAFKRQKQRRNERLSVSYGTDHDDPFGMRFDRSSASSHSQSSGFAVSMPKRNRRHLHGLMKSRMGRSRHRPADPDAVSLGSKISSSQHRASSRSSRRRSYESSMSQKLSDIEREIRAEERRKRRKKRRKKRQNRVQPILEPISSSLAALQAQRLRHLQQCSNPIIGSSEMSEISAHNGNINHNALVPANSFGSSNILSDSVLTGNSVSEIELPQTRQKQPDLSMFTAQAALPPTSGRNDKEDNSNGTISNLKGANPSPSGSYRRGRRREVKLEMTETSFYQEDEENIEMGGNQTIHTEENCQESGEIRGNLKELGPLVNEIFEQARAGSRNSSQTVGSSRLGSASSRGSKGSQTNLKDGLKYSTTKVHLPPERPRNDSDRTDRKRPFSGDYVLTSRRNNQKRDEGPRKSQSQPNSRVSSAVGHKRQIGHNGKLDFNEGLNWSRFLQGKGHSPGPMFGPSKEPFDKKSPRQYHHAPVIFDKHQGQLRIMDKSHFDGTNPSARLKSPILRAKSPTTVDPQTPEKQKPIHVCGHVGEGMNATYELKRPYTNPYRRYETNGDVLQDENEQDEDDSGFSSRLSQTQTGINILNVEAEHCRLCGAHKNFAQNADVLNIQAEQIKDNTDQPVNLDVLNVEAEHRTKLSDKSKGNVGTKKAPVDTNTNSNQNTDSGKSDGNLKPSAKTETEHRKPKNESKAETVDTKDENGHYELVKGDVLGNLHEVSVDVHQVDESLTRHENDRKQLLEVVRPHTGPGPVRPHTGPGPVNDEPTEHIDEPTSAFAGMGDRVKTGSNKVKTLASIPTDTGSENQAALKSVPTANTNVLNLEQIRALHLLKKRKLGSQGSLSSGSRTASAHTGSASSKNSRGRQQSQPKITVPGYNDKKLIDKKQAPAERNLGMFDFIDYEEFNSEYDDVTADDLTDTFTYTSCDDDLTEVSSLPC
ncbi:hypothetical protein ACF0H5_023205 [Mactra antiquata]